MSTRKKQPVETFQVTGRIKTFLFGYDREASRMRNFEMWGEEIKRVGGKFVCTRGFEVTGEREVFPRVIPSVLGVPVFVRSKYNAHDIFEYQTDASKTPYTCVLSGYWPGTLVTPGLYIWGAMPWDRFAGALQEGRAYDYTWDIPATELEA